MSSLRLLLRLLGAVCLLATTVYWFAAGAHRGWSMDQVPVRQTDEITGIEYTTYEDRFVPGIEVLGAGLAIGLAGLAGSFFGRRPRPAASE